MENKIIKATSDIFIRYLLGSEGNNALLLDFINAVLADADLQPIKKVMIKNSFNPRTFVSDKESILDIKAEDEKGSIYDIEMQVIDNIHFASRSLYYWARLHTRAVIRRITTSVGIIVTN